MKGFRILVIATLLVFVFSHTSFASLGYGHLYISEKLLTQMPQGLKNLIENEKSAYRAGANGHDIIYWGYFEGYTLNASEPTRPTTILDSKGQPTTFDLHTDALGYRTGKTALDILEMSKKYGNREKAFAIGWLTHWLTDAYIHTLIQHYGGSYGALEGENRHTQLEIVESKHICSDEKISKEVSWSQYSLLNEHLPGNFLNRLYEEHTFAPTSWNDGFMKTYATPALKFTYPPKWDKWSFMDFIKHGGSTVDYSIKCIQEFCETGQSACTRDRAEGVAHIWKSKKNSDLLSTSDYQDIKEAISIESTEVKNGQFMAKVKVNDNKLYGKFLKEWDRVANDIQEFVKNETFLEKVQEFLDKKEGDAGSSRKILESYFSNVNNILNPKEELAAFDENATKRYDDGTLRITDVFDIRNLEYEFIASCVGNISLDDENIIRERKLIGINFKEEVRLQGSRRGEAEITIPIFETDKNCAYALLVSFASGDSGSYTLYSPAGKSFEKKTEKEPKVFVYKKKFKEADYDNVKNDYYFKKLEFDTIVGNFKEEKGLIELGIEGPNSVELGKEVPLKATPKAKNKAGEEALKDARIEWVESNKIVGSGESFNFTPSQEKTYTLTANVVKEKAFPQEREVLADIKGKKDILASETHEIAVTKKRSLKITAPAEVMATDMFQVSAQLSPDIAGRANEYRWSGPALVNPDKKGGQTTKTPQATLQFQPMTGRSGDTFDPNQRIFLYVSDAAGLSVASGEVPIKLRPVGFSASASWEITPVRNGFDLKRKEAIKKTPCGDKTCSASVNGRLQLRWCDDSSCPDNMDDLKKSVGGLHAGKVRPTYHAVRPGKDEEFAIGDFKGLLAHKPPQLYYTGVPDMVDLSFPETISWAVGYLLKGKTGIFINGDVYGGGERKGEGGKFWFDDTPFVDLQTKAAYEEMMAILKSIAIGPDNKITTIPYKGPALDGSDLPRVKLVYSQKGKLKMGDVVSVKAVVENAKPEDSPLKFEWSGDHEGQGETVNFMARKAGRNTLSVTVNGARFSIGSASASFEVEDLKAVVVKEDPPANSFPIGKKARFSVALTSGGQKGSGNYFYRWQPSIEVTFEPPEGPSSKTTGTFRRTGRTNVWVEVLLKKGDVLSTLARSENLELDIINPKLSLSAVPEAPMVGQEVRVTVQEDPKMDEKTIDFWWEIAGNAANPGPLQNNRIYTYKPKDTNPVTVTVHGKGKDKGDDLGSQKITTTARAYTVSMSNPKYLGAKPRIWKCDTEFGKECPGLVEVGDIQFSVHHDLFMKASITPTVDRSKLKYGWTISPEGCTGGGSISDEIKLNCSNRGTYTAKVEVTNTDGAKLGEGTQSVTISISQETLDNSKKAKEAYDKLQKAKELVAQGKLDEGISLAEEASKLDPKNSEAPNLTAKWKKEKEAILQHIGRMKKLAEEGKPPEAEKELSGAKNLHPKYQPVIDAEKLLRAKADEVKEKIAKGRKLRDEGEVLQNQGKLEEAIRKYRESLNDVPDKALEEHIRQLEAKIADIKKNQSAANALWEEGRVLSSQDKPSDALSKFKESLKLWSLPDRVQYVKDFEARLNQRKADAKRLRAEGETFQNQKRYEEAINKYRASLKLWPDPKLEAYIKDLEVIAAKEKGKKEDADRLWNDGKGLYDQKKLSDALTKFKESLTYWSDQIRSEYVKKMEGAKATATRLRDEGYPLQQQGMIREAIAKYRESLTYWPDAELEKYIGEMEARMAQQNQQPPSPPPPTQTAFNLGKIWRVKQWIGKESWTWVWTRRGDSNTFDAVARHDQKGVESRHVIHFVSEKGVQVILSRPDAYGKYIGTLSPDRRRVVSGIMDSISHSDQGWTATIEGGQPQPVEGSGPQTLGRVWRVVEAEESPNGLKAYGTWTRRGSTDTFDAVWEISEGGGKVSDTITLESVSGDRVVLFRQGNSGRYTGTLSSNRKRIVSGSMSWTYRNKSWSWTAEIDEQGVTARTGQVSSPQTAGPVPASGQSSVIGEWKYHSSARIFVDVHEFLPGGRMGKDPKASWLLENNKLTVRWADGWVNVYTWDPQSTTWKGTATGPSGERQGITLVRSAPLPKQ